MSSDKLDQLEAILVAMPDCRAVARAVLDVWPEHASYLLRSFQPRSTDLLAVTEAAASAARKLMAGNEAGFAADYRWTCDQLRDEELFFHREGRYRLSTFAEAQAEVYSDYAYMARYMNGLLLSQLLWFNHVATLEMFLRLLATYQRPFRYLEVGPGHGLMVSFAATSPCVETLQAWDVSPVSLAHTRSALDSLEVSKPVRLTETDILGAAPPQDRYDLIVISEVLEHLERPGAALKFLKEALAPGGQIFINVPLNSPSPDHIYLLSSPGEARSLVEGAGLRVKDIELFATQARPIERALTDRISVSAAIVAASG